jgi:hypothetical protein
MLHLSTMSVGNCRNQNKLKYLFNWDDKNVCMHQHSIMDVDMTIWVC